MGSFRTLKNDADRYAAARNYRRAEKAYRELIHLQPSDPRLHVRLGDVLRKLGQPALAARSYCWASQLFSCEGMQARAKAARNLAGALDPSVLSAPHPLRASAAAAPRTQQGSLVRSVIRALQRLG